MAAVAGASTDFDVMVYDATSGGVTAAVSAARGGMRTALLCASWPACFSEGGKRVGGMSSGGLGQTDFGKHPDIIGGLSLVSKITLYCPMRMRSSAIHSSGILHSQPGLIR